ncbi:hypothetical protein KVG96_10255 [Pseudomonas sp. COR58]|uniref:DUF4124 domain-containing protein n=1 Tax=Pseudomonas ekonensis TaxID=2842353 RepID=A0ABS6PCZ4_9PSED|nr:hypothetical protein [Pseudomonas ekonensis]
MKRFKGYVVVAGMALMTAQAWADLPHSSILSRYGVSTDELPAPSKNEPAEPVEEKSRFQLQPEQPLVTVRLGDGKPPQETTGNLSIDNMARQDLERCQRMQAEVARRGGQYIRCDNSLPGMAPPSPY